MSVELETGVPWIMCKQTDAPDPVVFYHTLIFHCLSNHQSYINILWCVQINTCNGMRCGETFTGPNSPNKPSMWTENWTSLYVPLINSFLSLKS